MSSQPTHSSVVKEVSKAMDPDGYQLKAVKFILQVLYNLPKNKPLLELYLDHMVPFKEKDRALQHLWFALNTLKTVNCKKIENRLSSTTFEILEEEVLLRQFLVTIALELASKIERSKSFIRTVVVSEQLKDCPSFTHLMPPDEKQETHLSFLPHILKLFNIADEQGQIAPDDLSVLTQWLDSCNETKLIKKVTRFSLKEYRKTFVPFQAQCSEEGTGDVLVGVGVEAKKSNDSDELAGEGDESTAEERRKRFQEAHQESAGSRDSVGQVKN